MATASRFLDLARAGQVESHIQVAAFYLIKYRPTYAMPELHGHMWRGFSKMTEKATEPDELRIQDGADAEGPA